MRKALLPIPEVRAFPDLTEDIFLSLEDTFATQCSFKDSYLRSTYRSKYVSKETLSPALRAEAAISKWLLVEENNARTTTRLIADTPTWRWCDYDRFLTFARDRIASILGPLPDGLLSFGSFTNGASTSHGRNVGCLERKFVDNIDSTQEAWSLLSSSIEGFEGWSSHSAVHLEPRIVKGNTMFTVPKSTEIDRVAAKEPDFNLFGQKAVGDHIRRRLRVSGINLNDQSVNRNLAKLGSKTRDLATIDLSSASDTVTSALVSTLLSPDWFVVLSKLRSDFTLIPAHGGKDPEWHENWMFSSMGNGFTFELESLIFLVLAQTTAYFSRVKGRISVYGDDIIVPTVLARRLRGVLCWFGFKVNTKKSFWTGSFRESCGGHFHAGSDVTPFYIRRPIDSLDQLMLFLNNLRKWAARGQVFDICDSAYFRIWMKYSTLVPMDLCGSGDESMDTYLHVPGKPSRSSYLPKIVRLLKLEKELSLGGYLQWLSAADRCLKQAEIDNLPDLPESPSWRLSKQVHRRFVTRKGSGVWNVQPPSFLEELDAGVVHSDGVGG